jgi:hypothetical protein
MGDVEEILDRLATDDGFRADLARDPKNALGGYDLSTNDLRRLADALAAGDGHGDARDHHASLRALLTGHTEDTA